MSKHTPGPWALNKDGHVTVRDGTVLRAHGVAFGVRSTPESKANDRLIAAAPDLLEAVRGLLDALPSATTHPAIAAARAAIAKATGGEE